MCINPTRTGIIEIELESKRDNTDQEVSDWIEARRILDHKLDKPIEYRHLKAVWDRLQDALIALYDAN